MQSTLRFLAQRPLFSLTVVVTLGLSTALVAAVLGLVHEVFVRPLPQPQAERLAIVYSTYPERGWDRASASYPELRDLAERAKAFESVSAFAAFRNVNLTAEDGATMLETAFCEAGYLAAQGARVARGRLFTEQETRPGSDAAVAIVPHRVWQSRFGGRDDIIGTSIRLNDRPFTIVGVLHESHRDFSERWMATEIFLPFSLAPMAYGQQVLTSRGGREIYGLARLRDGVTVAQAQGEADRVAAELAREHPTDHAGRGLLLMPAREYLFREVQPLAGALAGGAAIVLLIACANLAHLFLVQAAGRQRELAVRAALGADRRDLVRLVLREIAVLTAIGAALGLLLAQVLAHVFSIEGLLPMPTFVEVRIHSGIIASTLAILAGCAAIFGVWPAWSASRVDLRASLHGGARETGDRSAARRRLLLVSAEVALATVLLVGTGMTARLLWRLAEVPTGYDHERLFTARLDLPRTRYPDRDALVRVSRQLQAELNSIPGVDAAALWGPQPLGRATYNVITTPEGLDHTDTANQFMIRRLHMTPDALGILKIPLLRGRVPVENPAPGAAPEIVVSHKYAERFFPGQDPVGRRVFISNSNPRRELIIVGVAAPVHHYPRVEREDNVLGDIYLSHWDIPTANLTLLVRTQGEAAGIYSAVKERVARIDPTVALFDARTMTDRLALQERPQRFAAGVFALYGTLATFLAVLGVYCVLAFTVAQRTREFGVRAALGASPRQIFSRLLVQGTLWIGAGLCVGLLVAFQLSGVTARLLTGTQTDDPAVYAVVAAVVLAVGYAAWLVPARRAARTDPIVALRAE